MALPIKTPVLPSFLEDAIHDHLQRLHQAIVNRSQELALQEARRSHVTEGTVLDEALQVSSVQCLRAIEEIAPGTSDPFGLTQSASFWEAFLESVSPVTLICSILTIAFAAFGLIIIHKEGRGEINPTAYLDIAKIFAGAIVGSASASALHSRTRMRNQR